MTTQTIDSINEVVVILKDAAQIADCWRPDRMDYPDTEGNIEITLTAYGHLEANLTLGHGITGNKDNVGMSIRDVLMDPEQFYTAIRDMAIKNKFAVDAKLIKHYNRTRA